MQGDVDYGVEVNADFDSVGRLFVKLLLGFEDIWAIALANRCNSILTSMDRREYRGRFSCRSMRLLLMLRMRGLGI